MKNSIHKEFLRHLVEGKISPARFAKASLDLCGSEVTPSDYKTIRRAYFLMKKIAIEADKSNHPLAKEYALKHNEKEYRDIFDV